MHQQLRVLMGLYSRGNWFVCQFARARTVGMEISFGRRYRVIILNRPLLVQHHAMDRQTACVLHPGQADTAQGVPRHETVFRQLCLFQFEKKTNGVRPARGPRWTLERKPTTLDNHQSEPGKET